MESQLVANPVSIRERIDEALESLANLSSSKKSRSDIIADLSRDLSEYYGYIQELSDFLLDLFSPAECVEYMDASDRPRPLVIRTNTLKTTRKDLMEQLSKRGATVEVVDWSKVAIKVTESSVPIGATPEYLSGYYMLQSAASLNPVMALAPLPGEKVLDMSAAPGGKTSYIAQLMKNSGTIIANDLKPQRQKATVANLHRLGVKNAIVCCYDGRKINHVFKGFDRVLLDAPCSGLGVISRDQSVKIQRTVKDIERIAHLQKELLRAAIDAVDHKSPTGGIIVYSTCSISTQENEAVVDYILSKRYVKLIDTGLEVGKPGYTRHKDRRFHPSLALTRRFYPHVHNMDGFYVAKFKKYAAGPRGEDDNNNEDEDEENQDETSQDHEDDDDNHNNSYDHDSNDSNSEEEEGELDLDDLNHDEEDKVNNNIITAGKKKSNKKSNTTDDNSSEEESDDEELPVPKLTKNNNNNSKVVKSTNNNSKNKFIDEEAENEDDEDNEGDDDEYPSDDTDNGHENNDDDDDDDEEEEIDEETIEYIKNKVMGKLLKQSKRKRLSLTAIREQNKKNKK